MRLAISLIVLNVFVWIDQSVTHQQTALYERTVIIDPCASNPCLNGICEVLSFGYFCSCHPNYEGVNCNRLKNSYCPYNPCWNNGTCTSLHGKEPYVCTCDSRFKGERCESIAGLSAVNKVNLNNENIIYVINETISLLQENPAVKHAINSKESKLKTVSDLLLRVLNMTLSQKGNVKVLDANSLIHLVDYFIEEALIFKSDLTLNSTQTLSKTFEKYVSNLKPGSKGYYSIAEKNLAVLTFILNDTDAVSTGYVQKDANTTNMEMVNDATKVDFNLVKSSAFLNPSLLKLFQNESLFSFTVYETSILFDVNSSILQHSTDLNCSHKYSNQIISNVISVNMDNYSKNLKINDTNFVKTFFRTLSSINEKCPNYFQSANYKCVYWDYSKAVWNSNGCKYSLTSEDLHSCECNHLTNFAILMTFEDFTEEKNCVVCQLILKYSTYFGNGLSILGLTITIIVYTIDLIKKKLNKANTISFKSMFDYYIEILISLSFSLLAMNVLYLLFSFLTWNTNLAMCMVVGILLHYFLLSSFAWMLCFSILQYLTFNRVLFVIKRFYLKSALFSFCFPLIPIVTVLSINWKLYQNAKLYCWLSDYPSVYGILLPIMLILITNIIIFTLIMRKHCSHCLCCCCCLRLFKKRQNSMRLNADSQVLRREHSIRRQTIIFLTCFLNLGLTWVTGFLLIIPIRSEYLRTAIAFLFCLFNSMQGFFLFVIYVLVSKSRQKYHSDKLKRSKLTTTLSNTITTTNGGETKIPGETLVYNQSNDTDIYSIDDYSKL